MGENLGILRCLRCRNHLSKSGKEPSRLVCERCGQEYHAVLQLIPIDPKPEERLLANVEPGDGTG